jgi:hypothetical protein
VTGRRNATQNYVHKVKFKQCFTSFCPEPSVLLCAVQLLLTLTLSVFLYVCGTWFLTPMEAHRLRVIDSTMLRKMFGSKRDEVMRECRRLHSKEH